MQSKKISNDQELIQSDPTSCPQNQKGKSGPLIQTHQYYYKTMMIPYIQRQNITR